jgi:hypothetical protein
VRTAATATAHVQRASASAGNGPFIVCGHNTRLGGGPGAGTGGPFSILDGNNNIRTEAVGRTFRIHGPQVQTCGLDSNDFKGRGRPELNVGKGLNQYWSGDNGVRAGPTMFAVNAIEGCPAGANEPYNCILVLPIAIANPPPQKQGWHIQYYVVRLAAFRVTRGPTPNTHEGTLLDDYIVSGSGTPNWCRDCGGAVTIKLTS